MTYLVVHVKSPRGITPLERKKYIESLYGCSQNVNSENRINGFFRKFSYALGYKKYDSSEYITPEHLISEGFYAYPEGEVLFEFFVKKGVTSADDSSFSYGNGAIASKWANFLRKVFPQLEVSIHVRKDKPGRTIWLSSFLFKSIERFPMMIETSIDEKLSNNQIESIKRIVRSVVGHSLRTEILQYYCSTCEKYNPDSPIHLEVNTVKGPL